jgi:hypothetical protein
MSTIVAGDTSPAQSLPYSFVTAAMITPDNVVFGSRDLGDASALVGVIVINSGTNELLITDITLIGANPADFTLGPVPFGSRRLAPGACCAVPVRFSPKAAGRRSAALTLRHNAHGSPHMVGLSGTGIGETDAE